jgi:predicted O-methyltransferase YrrM
MKDWIDSLFSNHEMLQMGHHQSGEDSNLGLGWIYYSLVRTTRPKTVVSIGSWRGFVPMVLAKGLKDNNDDGQLIFIDPSLADDFWKDPELVRAHFLKHDLDNVEHFQLTTEQFAGSDHFANLGEVGMLFVDGFHDEAHAKFDFESFESKFGPTTVTVFHDSVREFISGIYGDGNDYKQDVYLYMDELKANPDYQVFDFPFDSGMTLVRKTNDPNHAAFSPRLSRRVL